jgi:GT2 family glycosyltransferase/SAM-dependent methyltransferase
MNRVPPVSVVICSHNRSADASECLGALIPQIGDQAEVILVDSASDSKNQDDMVNLAGQYPAVKLIRADQPGLSLARNRGVELASGEWVVFLDDDAIPFPDWLRKLLPVVASAAPTQAVIGGGIYPRWPNGMSGEHLSKRWKMFLSLAEGDKPGSVTDGYSVNGANYAIRRRVLLDIGGFSEELGRVGASLISGDDCLVTERVIQAGLSAGFDPAFKVYHKISRERMKLSWILRRTFWEGVSEIRIFRSRGMPLPPHLRPIKLMASLPILFLRSIICFQNHDYKIRLAMCIGACTCLLTPMPRGRPGSQAGGATSGNTIRESVRTRKSLYRTIKDVWQLLPPEWNGRIKRAPIIGQIVRLVARVTVRNASHQEIYDQRYNDFLDAVARSSAAAMAATIKRIFHPDSVIDVGCGAGTLLAQLKQHGLEVRGLEYSDAGIARCREKGVQVEKFDLESKEAVQGKSDITVSFEVAEHLPESLADNYIRVISQFSPVVIMSAATVGQGGLDHVNEQPHEYWIEKMERRGFDYDKQCSYQVREEWAEKGVASWYVQNTLIFRKRNSQPGG